MNCAGVDGEDAGWDADNFLRRFGAASAEEAPDEEEAEAEAEDGAAAAAGPPPPPPPQVAPPGAAPALAPSAERPLCAECGREEGPEGGGRYGGGKHEGSFYCGSCWQAWGVQERAQLARPLYWQGQAEEEEEEERRRRAAAQAGADEDFTNFFDQYAGGEGTDEVDVDDVGWDAAQEQKHRPNELALPGSWERPRCVQCGQEEGMPGGGRYRRDEGGYSFFCGACWMSWDEEAKRAMMMGFAPVCSADPVCPAPAAVAEPLVECDAPDAPQCDSDGEDWRASDEEDDWGMLAALAGCGGGAPAASAGDLAEPCGAAARLGLEQFPLPYAPDFDDEAVEPEVEEERRRPWAWAAPHPDRGGGACAGTGAASSASGPAAGAEAADASAGGADGWRSCGWPDRRYDEVRPNSHGDINDDNGLSYGSRQGYEGAYGWGGTMERIPDDQGEIHDAGDDTRAYSDNNSYGSARDWGGAKGRALVSPGITRDARDESALYDSNSSNYGGARGWTGTNDWTSDCVVHPSSSSGSGGASGGADTTKRSPDTWCGAHETGHVSDTRDACWGAGYSGAGAGSYWQKSYSSGGSNYGASGPNGYGCGYGNGYRGAPDGS